MTRDDEIKLALNIFSQKKSLRRNWDWQWEEIALFTMPGKADFITERTMGDPARNKEIYDATAAVANHTLASHMHTALTNPATPWFTMRFRDAAVNKNDKAKEWIEDCNKRMFDAINDSNFVSIINELYQNLIAFGTDCLESNFFVDVREGFKLVFRSHPLNCLIFLEDVQSRIDTVYMEMKYTARQAKQKWPDENIDRVEQALKTNPEEEITFIKIMRPNPKFNPNRKGAKFRPIECIWTFEGKEIVTNYYFELIYHIPRWSKMTTDPYGYGPGLLALPETKTLNEAKRLELRAWEKAIDPPTMGTANGVIGDLHLEAGGFTSVRDLRSLAPIGDAANWTANQIKAEESRKSIQAIYLIDQLILPERPNATATEVQIRYTMMQKVLGPTAGRLEAELLNPLVNRIFAMMYRNGQFLEMPQDVAGSDIDVKYTGPLARAQTTDDAISIERFINYEAAADQVDSDILDRAKADRIVAEQYGVPAAALRSEDEVEKRLKAREEAARQAAEAEAAANNAATVQADEAAVQAPMQTDAMAQQLQ